MVTVYPENVIFWGNTGCVPMVTVYPENVIFVSDNTGFGPEPAFPPYYSVRTDVLNCLM